MNLTLETLKRDRLLLTANLPDDPRKATIQIATRMAGLIIDFQETESQARKDLKAWLTAALAGNQKMLEALKAAIEQALDQLDPLLNGEKPEKNEALQEVMARLDSLEERLESLEARLKTPGASSAHT